MKKKDCLVCAGVVILLLGVMLFRFTWIIVQVGGTSMEPTLRDGSFVVAKRGADINRNDIVFIQTAENSLIVKRVIAVAGDDVIVTENAVYVNGVLTDTLQNCRNGNFYQHIQVPNASVYVLGDNRLSSEDSRSYGCIALRQVIGVALA